MYAAPPLLAHEQQQVLRRRRGILDAVEGEHPLPVETDEGLLARVALSVEHVEEACERGGRIGWLPLLPGIAASDAQGCSF